MRPEVFAQSRCDDFAPRRLQFPLTAGHQEKGQTPQSEKVTAWSGKLHQKETGNRFTSFSHSDSVKRRSYYARSTGNTSSNCSVHRARFSPTRRHTTMDPATAFVAASRERPPMFAVFEITVEHKLPRIAHHHV